MHLEKCSSKIQNNTNFKYFNSTKVVLGYAITFCLQTYMIHIASYHVHTFAEVIFYDNCIAISGFGKTEKPWPAEHTHRENKKIRNKFLTWWYKAREGIIFWCVFYKADRITCTTLLHMLELQSTGNLRPRLSKST